MAYSHRNTMSASSPRSVECNSLDDFFNNVDFIKYHHSQNKEAEARIFVMMTEQNNRGQSRVTKEISELNGRKSVLDKQIAEVAQQLTNMRQLQHTMDKQDINLRASKTRLERQMTAIQLRNQKRIREIDQESFRSAKRLKTDQDPVDGSVSQSHLNATPTPFHSSSRLLKAPGDPENDLAEQSGYSTTLETDEYSKVGHGQSSSVEDRPSVVSDWGEMPTPSTAMKSPDRDDSSPCFGKECYQCLGIHDTCDGNHPQCSRCERLKLDCTWHWTGSAMNTHSPGFIKARTAERTSDIQEVSDGDTSAPCSVCDCEVPEDIGPEEVAGGTQEEIDRVYTIDTEEEALVSPVPQSPPKTNQQSKRTISYEEVWKAVTDPDSEHKHMIVEYPTGSDDWYILRCRIHNMTFGERPLRGSAKHVTIAQHGGRKRTDANAISEFGELVLGCNRLLANANNEAFKKALEAGYEPKNNLRKSWNRNRRRHTALGSGMGQEGHQAPPKSGYHTTPGKYKGKGSEAFLGMTNPEVGGIYQAGWSEQAGESSLTWYFVTVLPLDGWDQIGIDGCLPLSRLALPHELYEAKMIEHAKKAQEGSINGEVEARVQQAAPDPSPKLWRYRIPPCYSWEIENEVPRNLVWAKGFEDGGPRVRERKFPCLFLASPLEIPPPTTAFKLPDSLHVLAWVEAKYIRQRDFGHPAGAIVEALRDEDIARKFEDRIKAIQSKDRENGQDDNRDETPKDDNGSIDNGNVEVDIARMPKEERMTPLNMFQTPQTQYTPQMDSTRQSLVDVGFSKEDAIVIHDDDSDVTSEYAEIPPEKVNHNAAPVQEPCSSSNDRLLSVGPAPDLHPDKDVPILMPDLSTDGLQSTGTQTPPEGNGIKDKPNQVTPNPDPNASIASRSASVSTADGSTAQPSNVARQSGFPNPTCPRPQSEFRKRMTPAPYSRYGNSPGPPRFSSQPSRGPSGILNFTNDTESGGPQPSHARDTPFSNQRVETPPLRTPVLKSKSPYYGIPTKFR